MQQQIANPIVVGKDEWARIVKWTDENKEDPETVRRRDYLKFLNDTSQKMTKNWPNSLENVNKRNEELRRARIEAAENANTRFYKRYVKRKKEEQERLMYSARDTIFKNKDAPKLLLGAVIESVILKEREEQVKFNAKYMGAYQAEQKRLTDEMIVRQAKEWNDLQEEKRRRRFQANKQHQKDLVDQAHEISERKRREYEEELGMQRVDIANATKEIQDLKDFDQSFKEAERARIWADNAQSLQERARRRREAAAREDVDDRLGDVLVRSRARVEARRRATELEIRNQKLRVLEAISKKLESGDAARDAREQASLEKAIRERNAAIEARHQKQLAKAEQFRRQRVAAREQFLQDEQRRLHAQRTVQQWGLMNRFKNQEIYEEFKENQRKEKERKTLEYKEFINKQRKERSDRDARELSEQREFYGPCAERRLRGEDNRLLAHAAALLAEAARHGRPTRPIHKAIDRYCKMYRLYPMPDLPASLREHFAKYAPWDGSAPDAGYRPPSPPHGAAGGGGGGEGGAGGRAGLQEVVTEPQKSEEKKKTEPKPSPKEDYKRQGPANGLQRRSEKEEERLPRITVQPMSCKVKECFCDSEQ